MKSGHPLFPMDQTVSYPTPAVIFPQWPPLPSGPMLTSAGPNQGQQVPPHQPTLVSGHPPHLHHHGHHPIYAHTPQMRPPIGVFNPQIPSYMQLAHGPGPDGGATFVLPMQQLQQLQIANGQQGGFCLMNSPHPHAHPHGHTLYMSAPQPAPAPQQQSQAPPPPASSAPPAHDPSLVGSQVSSMNKKQIK